MSQILEQKILSDRAKLSLEKYKLDNDVAGLLGRPSNSEEIVLTLETRSGGYTTDPSVSWYISEQRLREVYNVIENEQDFRNASTVLREAKDFFRTTKKIEDSINKILKRIEYLRRN